MPQDSQKKTPVEANKDLADIIERLKRIQIRIMLNQAPPYGLGLILLEEIAPLLQSIPEMKNKLAKDSAIWKQNLEGMTSDQLISEKEILEYRKRYLNEEKEKFTKLPYGVGVIAEDLIRTTHAETNARLININSRLEFLSDLTSRVSEEKGKDITKNNKAELPPIDVWGNMPTPEYAPTTDPKSQFGGGSTGWGTISQVPLKDLKKLQGANKEQMEEMSKEMTAFVSAFDSGMQAVGQGINQWVGGAFRRTFGEANSLLEIFFLNFSNQLAQIGIQAGIGALFGALGIPVPSGKIGSSPVPSGPLSDSPIMEQATNFSLRNASSQGLQNMQLTTKISGSDLYIVLEKGKSNLLGRSLR